MDKFIAIFRNGSHGLSPVFLQQTYYGISAITINKERGYLEGKCS